MDAIPFVEVRVTQRFGVPAERAFDAWLDRATAGNWLFATASRPMSTVRMDARPGGAFRFADGRGAARAGRYLEIARPRRLVFEVAAGPRSRDVRRVSVEIAPQQGCCELTVVEQGLLPADAAQAEGRWEGMLYGLAILLDRQASGD